MVNIYTTIEISSLWLIFNSASSKYNFDRMKSLWPKNYYYPSKIRIHQLDRDWFSANLTAAENETYIITTTFYTFSLSDIS